MLLGRLPLVLLLLGAAVVPATTLTRERRSVPDGAQVSLTEMISSGQIAQAQEAAQVSPPLWGVKSFAHFFTVNKEYNSNIFFWYFPVTSGDSNAPLVLWMQGGPGTSSMLGLFTENGPVSISPDLTPVPRDLAWNKKVNLLYFDNPVGAGYSYTEDDRGYATNMDDVGTNLYAALIQFLQLFPDLQKKPFFLTGESYAGKYIPTLGHFIHKNNPTAALKVNLQGLAIGNGFVDPPLMLDYSDHFYQIGLVDDYGKAQFQAHQDLIRKYIALNQWDKASDVYANMMIGYPVTQYSSLFTNLTGFYNVYNYLYQNESIRYWIDYVEQPEIKSAIHVYDRSYSTGMVVKTYFWAEILRGVKPWVEELLGFYRVIIYTGQLDCIMPSKQVHDYMKTLVYSNTVEYHLAQRKKWWVGNKIAGYVKTAGRLTDLTVRDAGHMVPMDQPKFAWDLLDRFIKNKNFSDSP